MLKLKAAEKRKALIKSLLKIIEGYREREAAKNFLNGLEESLRNKSIWKSSSKAELRLISNLTINYFLRSITRKLGKRKRATDITLKIFETFGKQKAKYLNKKIEEMESSLNEEGRSFFR